MKSFLQFSLLTCFAIITLGSAVKMDIMFEWKYFDYEWQSSDAKQKAIDSGNYDFRKIVMIDTDQSMGNLKDFIIIGNKNKVFVDHNYSF